MPLDGTTIDTLPILEWLIGEECGALDDAGLIAGVGERLRATGLPLDRLGLYLRTLHPEFFGRALVWTPGEPVESENRDYGILALPAYAESPVRRAMESGLSVVVRLDRREAGVTVPDAFADRGLAELLILPFVNGDRPAGAAVLATARSTGFAGEERAALQRIVPALRTVCELRGLRHVERTLLDTYIGADSAHRVLAGHIRRGDFEVIEAALMFCDLHDFTALSNRLPAERVLSLLNCFFDQVVPAVEKEGGEILKFLGDGVLAIFRQGGSPPTDCAAAFAAARSVLSSLGRLTGPDIRPSAGIGLNHGEVSYGNVGAGHRLDFTVVGPAVNLTSRLQGLCGALSSPLLMSRRFAGLLGQQYVQPLGTHRLKGFSEPIEIFGAGTLVESVRTAYDRDRLLNA
jgi:adenylate cyclase